MEYQKEAKREALARFATEGLGAGHEKFLEWTGEGKCVLEIGCATGYLSARLVQQGCTVYGVELDPELAAEAGRHCRDVIVGNIEQQEIRQQFEKPFDVILLGDVLEHLVDPWDLLKWLRTMLLPNGFILVSIPNIAFYKIRCRLLIGRFDYVNFGVLDRTHLRFFTLPAFQRMVDDCGFQIEESWISDGQIPGGRRLKKMFGIQTLQNLLMVWRPNLFGCHFVHRLRLKQREG